MKQLIPIFVLAVILSACARLDDNLYDPDSNISEYQLDEYTGEISVHLDSSYDISADRIHQFTVTSDDNGDKATIHAVYIGDVSAIATGRVILYCHGNRDHMDYFWPRAKLLAHVGGKYGVGVLLFDYRGYGLSSGKPSESGLYADTRAVLSWLEEQGLSDERLIMYGFSMGTAPATELTAHPGALKPSKLILEAPFASAEVMLQDSTKLALPGSYLLNLKIDNAQEIKRVQQPFLWMHGREDDFLSIKTHGEVVYKNYRGEYRQAERIDGAGHSDIPMVMGFDRYLQTLNEFITTH